MAFAGDGPAELVAAADAFSNVLQGTSNAASRFESIFDIKDCGQEIYFSGQQSALQELPANIPDSDGLSDTNTSLLNFRTPTEIG